MTIKEMFEYLSRFREAAQEFWQKWSNLIDWPRTQSVIMDTHHNFVAEGIIRYAEVEGFNPGIQYETVNPGDEVWAVHVSELVPPINTLLSRIEDNIGPYISGTEIWITIKYLAGKMNRPSRGDPILFSDYYYPMAVIYYLTLFFLSPLITEFLELVEGVSITPGLVDYLALKEETQYAG